MIISFDIEGTDNLTPAMVAHQIGNLIGLPFEVVGSGTGFDDPVDLTIEISEEMIFEGFVSEPFNKE